MSPTPTVTVNLQSVKRHSSITITRSHVRCYKYLAEQRPRTRQGVTRCPGILPTKDIIMDVGVVMVTWPHVISSEIIKLVVTMKWNVVMFSVCL